MGGGMSESWDDDAGIPEEERPPLVLPLIATAVVAALLLLFAVAMPRSLDIAHNDNSIIGALVAGCMISIILWGIAFAITIRRAGGGVQVGSLLFILVLGVGAQIAAMTLAAHRIGGDMARVAEQFRAAGTGGADGPEQVPEGVGPVSRISAVVLNGMLHDRRAFDRDAVAIGVTQMLNAEGLTHSSPVLRRCAEFEPLAARARTIGGNGWEGHFSEARRIADEAVRNREMTAGDADAFFASATQNHYFYQRQWVLDAEIVEDAQELCELLARRAWVVRGGRVLFPSQADLNEAQFHLQRIQQNAAEQRIAVDASRRQMGEAAGQMED
jgi:hypothetical protein